MTVLEIYLEILTNFFEILYPPLNPRPLVPFNTEEIIGFTNEPGKGANKAPRNPSSCSK